MAIQTRRVYCVDTFTYDFINKKTGGHYGSNVTAANGLTMSTGKLAQKEYAWLVFEPVEDEFFTNNHIVSSTLNFYPTRYVPTLPADIPNLPMWLVSATQQRPPHEPAGNMDDYVNEAQGFFSSRAINMAAYASVSFFSTAWLRMALENSVILTFSVALASCQCPIASRHSAATPPYIEIQYEDGLAFAPEVEIVRPMFELVDGNGPVTFEWEYVHRYNSPQSAFDLQVLGGGEWVDLALRRPSAESRFVADGRQLPPGQTQWRVRAYSEGGAVSEWAEATFLVKGAPDKPEITEVSLSPRPVFVWSAANQAGYEAVLGEYASGMRYGAARRFACPYYLAGGRHTFRLRVVNNEGLWSDWTEFAFEVANRPGEDIALTAGPDAGNREVLLEWETTGEYEAFYILRGGRPIAKLAAHAETYSDPFSIGINEYRVRGVLAGGHYTDSNPALANLQCEHALLTTRESIDWLVLEKRLGTPPAHSETATADIALAHYEGRSGPVAYASGRRAARHRFAFSCESAADFGRLGWMLGHSVVYKDCTGELIFGVLAASRSSKMQVFDFEFEILQTDEEDTIAYD